LWVCPEVGRVKAKLLFLFYYNLLFVWSGNGCVLLCFSRLKE
jgi:hypothetical protein